MKNVTSLAVIVSSFIVVVSFENCAPAKFSDSSSQIAEGVAIKPDAPENGAVINQASHYTKLIFDRNYEKFDYNGAQGVRLIILLTNGYMSLEKFNRVNPSAVQITFNSCQIDDDRLRTLDGILTDARICQAQEEVQEGTMSCKAIAMPDIEMINETSGESVQLGEVVCNNGTYLCDGLDAKFRAVLEDLSANPPERCVTDLQKQIAEVSK